DRAAADPRVPHQRGRDRPAEPRQGARVRDDPRGRGRDGAVRAPVAAGSPVAALTGPSPTVPAPVVATAADRPARRPTGPVAVRRRRQALLRSVVLFWFALFFLLPLLAMLEFSTRGGGGRSLAAWRGIVADPDLLGAIRISLELAALTVLLMLG